MTALHIKPRDTDAVFGYAYVVAASILWGIQWPMSRFCQAQGVVPLEVAFWRALIGGSCFFLHALVIHKLPVRPKHAFALCLFGVWAIGIQFSILQIAVRESGAALTSVLLYSAPVWVAVFSRLVFGEALSRTKTITLVFALIGVVMICLSGGSLAGKEPSPLGIGLGLISAIIYATIFIFFVFWKDTYSTATIYAYMLLSGAFVLLPFLDICLEKSVLAWSGLFVMGVLTCYGAFFTYGQSLRFISPVKVAILCNLEPVIGTILCWLWWNENFPPLGWAGSMLVVGAIAILTLQREHEPQKSDRVDKSS